MKFTSASILILAAVLGVNAIDWQSVKPLHIEPKVAMVPRHILPGARITQGSDAERTQFTFQAGLMLYVEGGMAWCGGSLLGNRKVVTAAHCVDSLKTGLDVYLGAWNRTNPNEEGQLKIWVPKENVDVHEKWNPSTLANDIAMITLSEPVEFSEFIQPADLPPKTDNFEAYVGQQAVASGWGKTSDKANAITDILQHVQMEIMSKKSCANYYGSNTITKNHLCTKTTGGKSTCNGDSGGPLVLAGTRMLLGATSFGIIFGCEVNWPAAFTNVLAYRDWIVDRL